jgi:putative transposase
MKYWFMREYHQSHSVEKMDTTLRVSRNGYYKWLRRSCSGRKWESEELIEQIIAIQRRSQYRYGSPRVMMVLYRRGCSGWRESRGRLYGEYMDLVDA